MAATPLLGLSLPADGTTNWGTLVNTSITALLDSAIAGTTTLSSDADVTLTTTTEATNQARQAVLLCTGSRAALRTITAPAQSKTYVIINATTGGFGVKIVGVGPTTGVTIPNGRAYQVAWNGSDFVITGITTVNLATDVTGVLAIGNGGTGQSTQQAAINALVGTQTANRVLRSDGTNSTLAQVALATDVTGTLPIANGGTGQITQQAAINALVGTQTANRVLRSDGTNSTLSQVALATDVTGTLPIANGGTNSTGTPTAGGVAYGTGTAYAVTSVGPVGYFLTSGGSGAPTWTLPSSGVSSISFASTGLTPSTATTGAVTVGGTLGVGNGGTGKSSYILNGVLYASGTGTLANGSSLVFDGTNLGVGTNSPSSYGKVAVLSNADTKTSIVSTSVNDVDQPYLELRKTNNIGATASNQVGRISFYSRQGSVDTESAYINVRDNRVGGVSNPEIVLDTYKAGTGGGPRLKLAQYSELVSYDTFYYSATNGHTFAGVVNFQNYVGINETNPTTALFVAGPDNTVATFRNTDGSTAHISFYNDNGLGSNDVLCGSENSTFVIYTNTTKRVTVDDLGSLKMITGPVMPYAPAPTTLTGTATLTVANIQTQIINTTGTSYTLTMPLGTALESSNLWLENNIGYDFYVINTASGTVTFNGTTGVTTLGSLTVATGTSAQFRIRRTAASTFVLYRLS